MLPGMDGFETCHALRKKKVRSPILMLTALSAEVDKVKGLDLGADDYITKPLSLRELDLRIRSLLRRATTTPRATSDILVDGDLRVEVAAGRAVRDGEALTLTAREFDLLVWFLQHPGVVHSREDLIREVWGWNVGDPSTVTVHVRRLREKVETDPSRPTRLATVFGKGYRWDTDGSAGTP